MYIITKKDLGTIVIEYQARKTRLACRYGINM
jgi:hypothetical protein